MRYTEPIYDKDKCCLCGANAKTRGYFLGACLDCAEKLVRKAVKDGWPNKSRVAK